MKQRLQATYPQWEPPEDDPSAPPEEFVQVQTGRMRLVRNKKRVRLLKRRGVVMWEVCGVWCWFVERERLV